VAVDRLQRLNLIERADSVAGDLPYGMQRRIEIARALCVNPILLCLDEPAAGLNPRESAELNELLQSLVLDEPMSALDEAGIQVFERLLTDWRAAGITVLWIEHDLEAVGRLADRVTGLNRRVLFDATPQLALTPERLLTLFSTHPRSAV